MPSTLIAGGLLLLSHPDGFRVERGDVVVYDGRITEVRRTPDEIARGGQHDVLLDASGQLVMPGLLNLHTHSYAQLFRGRNDGLPLEAWAPYATAGTLGRTRREGYVSATLAAVEHLRTGTTTALDHLGGSLDSQIGALEAYRDIGLRVALAPMVADLDPLHTVPLNPRLLMSELGSDLAPVSSPADIVGQMESLFGDWHRPEEGTSVLPGPSGPQRCSPQLLEMCRELAEKHDVGVHAHLLETRVQALAARNSSAGSLVARLDRAGILDVPFSGAHAVWCSDEDLTRLAERGATLIHNPWSNLTLGSGFADIQAWRRAGVRRALGTDGVNCGGNLDMFRSIALATVVSRPGTDPSHWSAANEVLGMATEGGAHALGLEGLIGRIETGFFADLVLLDLPLLIGNDTSNIDAIVHSDPGAFVQTVIVGGRIVLKKGRVPGLALNELREEAAEAVERIEHRNASLFASARRQEPHLLGMVRHYGASVTPRDLAVGSHELE